MDMSALHVQMVHQVDNIQPHATGAVNQNNAAARFAQPGVVKFQPVTGSEVVVLDGKICKCRRHEQGQCRA